MKNKKHVLLILIISLVIMVLAGVGVVETLKQFIPQKTPQAIKIESNSLGTADTLKSQAYTALKNAQPDQAKKLFKQAREEYKKSNDNNAIAEIDGQLYLIDHSQPPVPTPTPTVIKTL